MTMHLSPDPDDSETNEELRARHQRVEAEITQARRKKRTDDRMRWIGMLTFTLLHIEGKMRERDLID
jgi:hypothetical protein